MRTIIIQLAANSANHLQNYVFVVSMVCNKARPLHYSKASCHYGDKKQTGE